MDIFPEDRISYRVFARRLFEQSPKNQNLIPFLGAGASLGPLELAKDIQSASPRRVVTSLKALYKKLGIKNKDGRSLVEFAVVLAQHLDEELTAGRQILERCDEAQYPPSVIELVRLFSELLGYKSLRDVAAVLKKRWADEFTTLDDAALTDILMQFVELTGIRRYTESLASISSYYETAQGREELWKSLHQYVGRKTTPTPTHRLVARSAKYYLLQRGRAEHDAYVIVTTNYDCLMERALDELNEPYVVVTVDHDGWIQARFSKGLEHLWEPSVPQRAKDFLSDEWPPLVIVYKLHGSLQADYDPKTDNVIISEGDYVRFLAKMGDPLGAVPAAVAKVLIKRPFLFLAYSLNDWNVRAIFEGIRAARAGTRTDDRRPDDPDFAVLRDVTTFEQIYCKKKNVTILQTDLNSFVSGIQKCAPPDAELEAS